MKLPISDQFLLDIVYPLLSKSDDVLDFLLSDRYRQINIIFGNENPVIKKYKKDNRKQKFDQLVYRLKRGNYIRIENLKGKSAIMLTKQGFDKALEASFKVASKEKRKDGKWIMIAFDIPQKYRKSRNLLRSVLRNLGYKLFQQSVWVTPYDVAEKTEKLLQIYSLDKYVKIFLIEPL